jgi:DhnA family fructose-bisphosphate aldolase class Ia
MTELTSTVARLVDSYPNSGKDIRMGRILDPKRSRAAVVAFDHGEFVGLMPGNTEPGRVLEMLADAGADAFLVGPGVARAYAGVFSGRGAPGLILRMDWTNRWRDPEMLGSAEGRGRLIASVEDAARLGADAVLVYMFIGYQDPEVEARQVADVARVAQDCERAGIGCIIEPMPRGLRVGDNPYRSEYIALGARMACELGGDLLKTDYSGDPESFRTVVSASFRPILIAGGPKTSSLRQALEMVQGALDAGAHGMFIGRNVFQAPDPARMMRTLRSMIHDDLSLEAALEALTA